jgi:hypothetical protein
MRLALFTSSLLLDPWQGERSRPFVEAVPATFAAAENAPGFIWLSEEVEPELDVYGKLKPTFPSYYKAQDRIAQTLSAWTDISSAWNYVYTSDRHLHALKKRTDWMQKPVRAQYVLWWRSDSKMPTHSEAVERLEALDASGPSSNAFTFRTAFSTEGKPTVARQSA